MNEEFERNEEQFFKEIEAFEKLLKNNEVHFFDAERFEEFFDHYLTKNKISKAEKVINMALSQHPFSSELRLRKAQVLIRKKKYLQQYLLFHLDRQIPKTSSSKF